MIMKARVLIMAIMVAFTSFANAQKQQKVENVEPEKKMEIRANKMADRLLLDESKAKKFVPLYKEYLEAKAECRPELVRGENLSDSQIEDNLEAMMDAREKELEVDKKYYKKFAKVLNAKQLEVLFGCKAKSSKRPMGHGKGVHGSR